MTNSANRESLLNLSSLLGLFKPHTQKATDSTSIRVL